MKVVRTALVVSATAIFAAACGDKVTVPPAVPAATISSVQVAPSTATITVGQSVTLTAAVNTAPGVTATVTWTSSNPAAASVNNGAVLGVAASPGVAICATATAGTASQENCATIVVQSAAAVVQPVLQIASITTAGNLNAPVAVPPGTVTGQINVSVNVNPGTQQMDSVVVMVNGISASTQSFTGAQAAALRAATSGAPATSAGATTSASTSSSASTGSAADQALQGTLVFSVNTAAYTSAGCATQVAPCGTATFLNGSAAISVVGYGHQGTAPSSTTTTQSINLLFANPDAWIVAQTLSTGTNTALSPTGFSYSGGPLAAVSVTAVPVSYSGKAITLASVNFGSPACDASGSPQRVQTMTAPVAPSRAWTATFSRTALAPAHANDVNNYEFSAVACAAANASGGEGASIANAQYANTTAPTGFAQGSAIPAVRLDDRAPGVPSLMQNPRIRMWGWINAQVGLNAYNTGAPGTADNVVVAGTPDGGVAGTTAWVRLAVPGAGGVIDPALAATPTNAAAIGTGLLAPTAMPNSICGVWTSRDALGNESPLPAAGTVCSPPAVAPNTALAAADMLFGVDIAPPTIAMSNGGLLASSAGVNASLGVDVGGEFQVMATDTGAVGNSGIPLANALIASVSIRSPTAGLTPAQLCPVGTVANGVCTPSTTGTGVMTPPFLNTGNVALQSITGYYTFTGQSVDAAGNMSTTVATRVRTYEPGVPPVVTPASFTPPLTGTTVTFSSNAASNFDLWAAGYQILYAGAALPIVYSAVFFNTFNNPPFVNSNVNSQTTLNGFFRQVEVVATNSPLTTTGPAGKPTTFTALVNDMAGVVSAPAVTNIPAVDVATGISYLDAVTWPAPLRVDSWLVTNTAKNISTGAGPAAPANPLSILLTAVVKGPTPTFSAPFALVNFYVVTAVGFEQIGTARGYTAGGDGTAFGQSYTYSLTWTPGVNSPVSGLPYVLGAQQIFAIGVDAAGDGLSTFANANITLTNP